MKYENLSPETLMNMPYLTQEEVKRLLDVISDTEHKTAIMLGLDLGCRAGEIITIPNLPSFGMQIPILDSKSENAVKRHKTNRNPYRSCVLTQAALSQIINFQNYLKITKDKRKLLFPYSERTVTRWLQHYCKKAGIMRSENSSIIKKGKRKDKKLKWTSIRWHMLRHTYIQNCMNKKVPIKQISEQTGDSVYTLIQHYTNYTTEDRIKEAERTSLL